MKISEQKNIKNVIFDLGGVIININPMLTVNGFKNLGNPDFEKVYKQFIDEGLFNAIESGQIGEQEFRETFYRNMKSTLTDNEFNNIWNLMLLDYPPKRIELLQKLKTKYRTFLLSNTNQIHYKFYTEKLQHEFGISGLQSFFEKAYFSFEIKLLKPNLEIYNYVLADSGLKPEETIFIDDFSVNIEGAKKAGLLTHWLEPGQDICDLF